MPSFSLPCKPVTIQIKPREQKRKTPKQATYREFRLKFRYDDLVTIINRLGFNERNTGGIHRIFTIDGIEGIIICKTQKMARQTPTR